MAGNRFTIESPSTAEIINPTVASDRQFSTARDIQSDEQLVRTPKVSNRQRLEQAAKLAQRLAGEAAYVAVVPHAKIGPGVGQQLRERVEDVSQTPVPYSNYQRHPDTDYYDKHDSHRASSFFRTNGVRINILPKKGTKVGGRSGGIVGLMGKSKGLNLFSLKTKSLELGKTSGPRAGGFIGSFLSTKRGSQSAKVKKAGKPKTVIVPLAGGGFGAIQVRNKAKQSKAPKQSKSFLNAKFNLFGSLRKK